MQTCRDNRRVYIAPDPFERIKLAATALKKKMPVQVLLDDSKGETMDSAVPLATYILVTIPPLPPLDSR